MKYRGVF